MVAAKLSMPISIIVDFHILLPQSRGLKAAVEAERTRSERGDLKETADHGNVLEEMNHLVLIGEIVVEENGRRRGGAISLVTQPPPI
jgi:hypothetical protein